MFSKLNFSAFHLNISSLSRHFDEFNALLGILNINFSVIGISESRFLEHSPPIFNFSLDGFSVEHRPTESSAGGALLYISNRYNYTPRADLEKIMYLPRELESVFVEISFSQKSNFIVGCIYKHPAMPISIFNTEFLSPFLQYVSRENKTLVLLGDFNIDLLKHSTNREVSNFLDILGSHLIIPHVLLPTRITETSKTLIDNIFSTITGSDCASGNLLHSVSDHLAQFLLISSGVKPINDESISRSYQQWSKFNHKNFMEDFRGLNWHEILKMRDQNIDVSFNCFSSKISELVDRHLPTRKLTRRQLKSQKPWITSGLLKSMAKRDLYFRKFLRAKSQNSKSIFHNLFKQYRNQIVSLCRLSKSNYFTRYFDMHSKDIRKIWQGVSNIISLKGSNSPKPISLKIGNAVISNPLAVANEFNTYFTSVADAIRSSIPQCDKHFSSFLKHPNPNSIFLSPVTSDEVSKIISSMPSSKAYGPNSVPTRILKLICNEVSSPLADIINLSFTTGQFPSALKISKVVPIFKKGTPLEPSNYRPISLLSNIDKIFEKLMYLRVISFLESHSIIYSRQFGFRKSHSTTHALLNLVERIRQCLDKGQVAVGVFVDLQKAFDTVDHKILCHKLNHYGIRGLANRWFSTYLSSRYQFVSVANSKSNLRRVWHGVPQGSVLGPLLFLLYINDLHSAVKSSEITHFADKFL